jgi:uncharacterized protein with FMN-binding domain
MLVIALAFLVLAGVLALRASTRRPRYQGLFAEGREQVVRKTSKGLITVTSVAILAVYAAGYERTYAAARRLAARAEVQQAQYQDGAYLGWGSCPHGTIQVQVVIQSGRISSADITQCRTRYPCSVIKDTPSRFVGRQNAGTVDYISGATQSLDAYYGAVVNALKDATKQLN